MRKTLTDSIPEEIVYNLNMKLTTNQNAQFISLPVVSCKR